MKWFPPYGNPDHGRINIRRILRTQTAEQRGQIQRHPLGDQIAKQPQQYGNRVLPGEAGRTCQMGPVTQDAAYHAAARTARTHFEKQAHAVPIRRLDNIREVEAVQRLAEDGSSGIFAGDVVGTALYAAVKSDSVGLFRRENMQVVVRNGYLPGNFAMNRGDTLQGVKTAVEPCDELLDRRRIATDHTFVLCVDDKKIGPGYFGKKTAYIAGRSLHDPQAPLYRFVFAQSPRQPGGTAFSGHVMGEES